MDPLLADVPAAWLRASCTCSTCVDPASGQRLASITDLPAEAALAEVGREGPEILVTFAPDGHRARFNLTWLAQAQAPRPDARTEDAKRLWRAADFPAGPPVTGWEQYQAGARERAAFLASLLSDGFALLGNLPRTPGTVLEVAGNLGYVRETNYGRLFDVRVNAEASNLAFTSMGIAPHTDNPYRDPVPTVQLLHCLANAAEGGESALIDGFMAARLLRDEHPAAFAVLSSTPVTFTYSDSTSALQATRPMIGIDPYGRIREIRFNNRSMQPLRRVPGPGPADQAGFGSQAEAFYSAYRVFAEILLRPELALTFKLSPGQCVAFDNTRILHARTAFTATGSRHLQGCYADLDGIESRLAVLCRDDRKLSP